MLYKITDISDGFVDFIFTAELVSPASKEEASNKQIKFKFL
jgi:hypothetical protein